MPDYNVTLAERESLRALINQREDITIRIQAILAETHARLGLAPEKTLTYSVSTGVLSVIDRPVS